MIGAGLLDLLLVVLIIAVALWTIAARDAFSSIIGFVVFGLVLGLIWLRLEAPDVGLTEVAIGSGATGVLLLRARGLSRDRDEMSVLPGKPLRIAAALLCALVSAGLAALVLTPVDPAPTLAYLAAENLSLTGVGNPITAVLMAYRAFDTFLETVVVLLALIGVWSLTPDRFWGGRPGDAPAAAQPGALVLFAQLLAPVGVIIGIYVFWVGADEPGGKFQGATILAAMWVLVMMAGLTDAPPVAARWLRAALLIGPVVFIAVGLAGFWLAGSFLAYPPDYAKPLIIVIEAGMLISVAATLGMLLAGPARREPEA